MARGKRPVTFRTRKLSLSAPMVLPWRRGGRVGRRRTTIPEGAPALVPGPLSACPVTAGRRPAVPPAGDQRAELAPRLPYLVQRPPAVQPVGRLPGAAGVQGLVLEQLEAGCVGGMAGR